MPDIADIAFAQQNHGDLTKGPEAPLVISVVDAFKQKAGLMILAPPKVRHQKVHVYKDSFAIISTAAYQKLY